MVKLNTKFSIVDYLKSQKKDSSFSSRAKSAKALGIKNYTGTASQNQQLLKALQGKSSAKAPAKASGQKLNTNTSIVDYLKSMNKDSSIGARSKTAQSLGIKNYTGTASQNVQMLNALKKQADSAKKPAVAKPVVNKPVVNKPVVNKPVVNKPDVSKPGNTTGAIPGVGDNTTGGVDINKLIQDALGKQQTGFDDMFANQNMLNDKKYADLVDGIGKKGVHMYEPGGQENTGLEVGQTMNNSMNDGLYNYMNNIWNGGM